MIRCNARVFIGRIESGSIDSLQEEEDGDKQEDEGDAMMIGCLWEQEDENGEE